MRILLILLLAGLYVADIFAVDIRVAPGLSLKNALLNLLAFGLAVRFAIRPGSFNLKLPSMQAGMAIWFGYALFTWVILGVILHFRHYELLDSAIQLKGWLLDYFIIFGVFFYGTVTTKDAIAIIKVLLVGLVLANLASLVSATGVVTIGENVQGEVGEEAGRIFGAFGHANETAAMTVFLLPALIAAAAFSRGMMRFGWSIGAMICLLMLVMTGSRGGYAALFIGGAWGVYTCRRFVPVGRVITGVALLLIIAVPVLAVLQLKFDALPVARLVETILHPGHHGADRGDIWAPVMQKMMESPWTLFTGFGWNSYASMGFYFATHNHYLLLWFELGLIGVGCYLFIIWRSAVTALDGAAASSGETNALLTAFALGIPILTVAIFFSLLFKPWLYIWAYIGVAMRLAVIALDEQRSQRRLQQRASAQSSLLRKGVMSKGSLSNRA